MGIGERGNLQNKYESIYWNFQNRQVGQGQVNGRAPYIQWQVKSNVGSICYTLAPLLFQPGK